MGSLFDHFKLQFILAYLLKYDIFLVVLYETHISDSYAPINSEYNVPKKEVSSRKFHIDTNNLVSRVFLSAILSLNFDNSLPFKQ